MKEKIKALSVSSGKGMPKSPVSSVRFIAGKGIEGDAHAGQGRRQVSLLFENSLLEMKEEGIRVSAGDMAENILLTGPPPASLKKGDILKINRARLKVTQLGKDCRDLCSIGKKLGSCAMSDEGIFLQVLSSGAAQIGDEAVKND